MAALESMQHGQGERVIDVVAHVGVENDVGGSLRQSSSRECDDQAENQDRNPHRLLFPPVNPSREKYTWESQRQRNVSSNCHPERSIPIRSRIEMRSRRTPT